ncbi:MAG: DUF1015 domain-containing protein [Candidatus Brocadiae bacterium]|nr:DUF1015 domain-containing protein [Candidatus Brocadiia bacterium]
MVNIIPFRGFRPCPELVQKIAAVPYDVVDNQEAKDMVKDNPHSFLHIEKSEIDVDSYEDAHDEKIYAKGVENLRRFFKEGFLIQDKTPCFYVYSQKLGEHKQYGLVAGASVLEYQKEIIKKHEKTRADKELDRIKHVDALNANTGPVFLTYKSVPQIDRIIEEVCNQKPVYDFSTPDTVHHTFWLINNKECIEKLCQEFAKIPFMYIADGHHRSAAASKVCEIRQAKNPLHNGEEQYNYFLSVIFPDNQLNVMAYNRVVKTLNGFSAKSFIEKLKEKFDIQPASSPSPTQANTFGMFIENQWYSLRFHKALLQGADVVDKLDVSILQNHVLDPLLGIKDPRKDERISFFGGIRGTKVLEDAVKKQKEGVAFALYPVSVQQLIDISDAGRIMPPKSTWFEPKLRSGVITKALI